MKARPGRRRVVAMAAVAVAALLAVASYAGARALGGDELPQRQLVNRGRPANGPGQLLELVRVTIPAGARIETHTHPGMQIIYLEEGEISYTVVRGAIRLRRAPLPDGSPGPVEIVGAGQTVTIEAGDSFIERKGMVHSVVNDGTVQAVVLASSLFPASKPANIPVP